METKIAVFLPLFYPYFNGFNRQNFNPLSTIPLLRNLTSIRFGCLIVLIAHINKLWFSQQC